MLEIKYNKNTGKILAWASSPEHKGGHYQPKEDEAILLLDTIAPEKKSSAYLVDVPTQKLIDNSEYVEPIPVRNYGKEIDAIKDDIIKLKEK